MSELISKVQKNIESIYGIRIGERAKDYLIDEGELRSILSADLNTSLPRELFLISPQPENDTVELALFIDDTLFDNLVTNNPFETLDKDNMNDFCTLIEGVSHFVYYLHKAELEYNVTQLELELQAEIDKFFLLSFLTESHKTQNAHFLDILFKDYQLHDHLDLAERERYHDATDLARKFCFEISKDWQNKSLAEIVKNLRQFYPLPQEEKIRQIMN